MGGAAKQTAEGVHEVEAGEMVNEMGPPLTLPLVVVVVTVQSQVELAHPHQSHFSPPTDSG